MSAPHSQLSVDVVFTIRGVPNEITEAASRAIAEQRANKGTKFLSIKDWLALMDLTPDSPLMPYTFEHTVGWDEIPVMKLTAHTRKEF